MSTTTVASRTALLDALSSARGGETIILKDGKYGSVTITADYASTVTLRAEDPLDAEISSLLVSGASNLRFDSIKFDSGTNGGSGGKVVGIENGSRNVAIVNSEVTGKEDNVYSGHNGIYVDQSSGIVLANNDIHDVFNGLVVRRSDDVEVLGNRIDYIGNDVIKFGGLNGAVFENNVSFGHVFPSPGAHNDFIQGQGNSDNLVLSGNVYLANTEGTVQGIFLSNATYNNVLVEQNIVYTGLIRGITVANGKNVVVRDNTLLDIPNEVHKGTGIDVPGGSVVSNNIFTAYQGGMSGNNLKLQNLDPGGSYYVDDYFQNGSAGRGVTLRDLTPVKGSLAETKGAAARLAELLGGASAPAPKPEPAPQPDSKPAEPEPAPAPSSDEAALNAGGKAANGFAADAYFSSGKTFGTGASIAGTAQNALYQTERYGDFDYAIPVENGTYDVTLHFAEIYHGGAGKRLFDVRAEGALALDNFDVYQAAGGKNVAHDETIRVKVSDGRLNLTFDSVRDNAKVSGIEIAPASGSAPAPSPAPAPSAPSGADGIAVNAGGKASGAFDADSFYFGGKTHDTGASIAGTSQDALYQSERYGDFRYSMAVENGLHDVTLKFAEIYFGEAGARVFDVRAEGDLVIDNLDIYKAAGGKNVAYDQTLQVEVTDGRLDLEFISQVNNAKLSGIEIDFG